jgi:hypothetical protein
MCARHRAEFFRPVDAGEAHEVLDRGFVRAPCARIGEVGEPFDFGRNLRQLMKFGGGQEAI